MIEDANCKVYVVKSYESYFGICYLNVVELSLNIVVLLLEFLSAKQDINDYDWLKYIINWSCRILGDISNGLAKDKFKVMVSFLYFSTTHVKLSLELLKLSSYSLLSYGCTYTTVLLWFIQEVLIFVFIWLLNFITAYLFWLTDSKIP